MVMLLSSVMRHGVAAQPSSGVARSQSKFLRISDTACRRWSVKASRYSDAGARVGLAVELLKSRERVSNGRTRLGVVGGFNP